MPLRRTEKHIFVRTNVIASEYVFLFRDYFASSLDVRVADGPVSPIQENAIGTKLQLSISKIC